MFDFLFRLFRGKCCAPGCSKTASEYPHGIPCCEEHAHEVECSSWLGYDCDCGKE